MNKPSGWSALLLGLLLAVMSGVSVADRGHGGHGGHGGHHGGHGHVGVGVVVNPFWFDPWYYPGPYYYPPAVVAVPTTPPVYIEREEGSPSAYWYYCANPQGYYPDVKQCPAGWQPVAPLPPVPSSEER